MRAIVDCGPFGRILLGGIATIALSVGAITARADSVVFTTTGTFSSPGIGDTLGEGGMSYDTPNDTVQSGVGLTSSFVTFEAGPVGGSGPITLTNPGDHSVINLGDFLVGSGSPSSASLSANFVLKVTETSPVSQNNSFSTATLSGTVTSSNSQLEVVFTPTSGGAPSISIGGETYSLNGGLPNGNTYGLNGGSLSSPGITTVGGVVTLTGSQSASAPLPKSSYGAVALLGGLWVFKSLRSRKTPAEACAV